MQTRQGAPLIGGLPQDIVFFFEETLCHRKVKSSVVSQSSRVGVHDDDKYDIRANLDQRFIDID